MPEWVPVPASAETWTGDDANTETWFDVSLTYVLAASGAAILTAGGQLVVLT